ncbi:hypothetical protein BDV93DRAFT_592678 [Ceratobasidium sp. AG-I]|nr:hypothetical protein BDV93DRAFT_592678 [Ceratobasidium sp. AG-I]
MTSDKGSTNESLPTFSEANLKTILVCGISGVGKSRFINTVTGSKLPVGHSTFSETKEITEDGIPLIKMGDKYIQLVDTPGFQDSRDEDEAPVFQNIADWLAKRYKANFRVTGFIYLRSIQEPRVLRAETGLIKMFKKLCGEDAIDHIVLTTNRWYPPPEKEEEDREAEMISDPRRFGSTGPKRVQVQRLNGKYQHEDALPILRVFENLGPVTLQIQDEMNNARLQENGEMARKNMELIQEQLKAAEGQNESLKQSIQERLKAAEEQNESQKQLMQEQLEASKGQNESIQARLKAAEEQNESLKQSVQERAANSGGHFWDSFGRVVGGLATLGISELLRD